MSSIAMRTALSNVQAPSIAVSSGGAVCASANGRSGAASVASASSVASTSVGTAPRPAPAVQTLADAEQADQAASRNIALFAGIGVAVTIALVLLFNVLGIFLFAPIYAFMGLSAIVMPFLIARKSSTEEQLSAARSAASSAQASAHADNSRGVRVAATPAAPVAVANVSTSAALAAPTR